MTERDLRLLADLAQNRFFGKYRATVQDNADSEMRGRLKVRVPAVLGNVDVWAEPCVPYAGAGVGFLMLPDPGTGAWVEFEGGDPSYPIWVGCFWANGQLPDLTGADMKSITTGATVLKLDDATRTASMTSNSGGEARVSGEAVLDAGGATVTVGMGGVVAEKGGKSVNVSDVMVSINSGSLDVL